MGSMTSSPGAMQGVSSMGGAALSAAGEVSKGAAAKKIAARKAAEAEYEAQQLDQNAGQSVAAAQRAAMEENRKASLVASRALAIAAASGGATSQGIADILASITAQGQYNAMMELYQGEDRARTMKMQAEAKRYSGEMGMGDAEDADKFAKMSAFSTVMSDAPKNASLYKKYFSGKGDSGASSFFDTDGGLMSSSGGT